MISKSVVIDTNMIFSALIPKASKIRDLNIPIWTGDKKLKDGLRLKGFDDFFTE